MVWAVAIYLATNVIVAEFVRWCGRKGLVMEESEAEKSQDWRVYVACLIAGSIIAILAAIVVAIQTWGER